MSITPTFSILAAAALLSLVLCAACQEPDDSDGNLCLEDTTSHNFIWEVDTIGTPLAYARAIDASSSSNVWAVGRFHTRETWDNRDTPYNAALWNGSIWTHHRILGRTYYDSLVVGNLRAIHVSSENDVWISTVFGSYSHLEGNEWESKFITKISGTVYDIWGSEPQNMFFVGSNGSITSYDGAIFVEMESGIDYTLNEIFGLDDEHIWILGFTDKPPGIRNVVLSYQAGQWVELHNREEFIDNYPPSDFTRPSGEIESVWAYGDTLYLGCASLWKESITTGEGYLLPPQEMEWSPGKGINVLTGNHCNDIFAFSRLGLRMTHYNGVSWKRDQTLEQYDPNFTFQIKGATVTATDVFILCDDLMSGNSLVFRGMRP